MNIRHLLLILCVSLFFAGCKEKDKKEDLIKHTLWKFVKCEKLKTSEFMEYPTSELGEYILFFRKDNVCEFLSNCAYNQGKFNVGQNNTILLYFQEDASNLSCKKTLFGEWEYLICNALNKSKTFEISGKQLVIYAIEYDLYFESVEIIN